MKIGIDTNVLIRAFVNDGSAQFNAVSRLMRENHIVISSTVLLETEWVLRDTFKLARGMVANAFETLLGARHVSLLESDAVVRALDGLRAGCDFADVLHLALNREVEAFVTFDKRFARRAASLALTPPVELLKP
jgi:predicted nucleic-acid-binding protein